MANTILFRGISDLTSRSVPTAPWGLLFVAAPLVARGDNVTIIDEWTCRDYAVLLPNLLDEKKPVAVGISTITGEQIRRGLAFAQLVRNHDASIPIIWGGVHPTLLPEQTVEHELVDYVVVGEGELSYAELLRRIEIGEDTADIPGVYQKREGQVIGRLPGDFIDLEALPPLPYDLLDIEAYIQPRRDLGVQRYFEMCSSRGCPHRCAFCYSEAVHRRRWRMLTAEETVQQLKELQAKYDLDGLYFREDNFFVSEKRVREIAERLIEERINIKWCGSCRIDYFSKYSQDFIDLIKESGCVYLTFGVESGSNRVLGIAQKDITVGMILDVVRKVKDNGLKASYHFMGGFPGETQEELLDTCRMIDEMIRIAPESVVREMFVFTAFPGVGLMQAAESGGYLQPTHLEAWTQEDWQSAERPWIDVPTAKLISDIQFLIARLNHPNPVYRAWVQRRWRQMLASQRGIAMPERRLIETVKRLIGR